MSGYRADAPVIVLGMHRSGTSCLAGSLHEAGLHLGDVNEQAKHNAKGNRESEAIMHLHEHLLAANRCRWDKPSGSVTWRPEHERRRDEIIESFPADRVWGFKDPRTLLTLAGWLDALPGARLVGTFRDPTSVALSLKARNRFSMSKGLDLWLAYNSRLLVYCRDVGVELISFDEAPSIYQERVRQIATRLQLPDPKWGGAFFTPELRAERQARRNRRLPEAVRSVYGQLQELRDDQRTG